ncbi:MAG: site-specific DNA-methyltransferase [Proteobacteria bacterium]|nr:site-specific DNA-methyltransferase [Pseudomonadota bacterium]
MPKKKKTTSRKTADKKTGNYSHPEASALLRPEIGAQAQFKKKKKPITYRYDSSLSPELNWDGQNPAREEGEALIAEILNAESIDDAKTAAEKLKNLSKPFLNWAGRAERLSFDVPTLPLFVHERLSTQAILETLKGHKRDKQVDMFDLFGEHEMPLHEKLLKAYEHKNGWVNRMILGDSLVVMNSLLHYESLGGQVQMIYIDPPYGVKFGSNFQPFVRNRDVKHNEDDDMTREPEMVKAYRDTWELGLHSYLTYLRDRLLIARELLDVKGSIFIQISDDNVHHVREIMDEIFGEDNFVSQIVFKTTGGFETKTISTQGDFILWYAKDKNNVKVRKLFEPHELILGEGNARWILLQDNSYRGVTSAEVRGENSLPKGAKLYRPQGLQSQGKSSEPQPFEHEGKVYSPRADSHWKANYPDGMNKLANADRIHVARNSLQYRRFADDFPFIEIGNIWTDTMTGSFTEEKSFAVQTNTKVIERCILLVTDPGDLIIDPTCGSGTTAYVAEKWGRRWITCDTSRVPLALARQRLLTATYPYYELKESVRGPVGGFVYERKQNKKGEEIGGIITHVTLKSIANNETPKEEVIVNRPKNNDSITRVTGPFCVEASIPTPVDWKGDGEEDSGIDEIVESHGIFTDRMLEILRRSPVLHLTGGQTIQFKNIRLPAKTLSLSAEALVENGEERPVAILFGPENGAVSEKLTYEAAREAVAKSYSHLYVIGFAIQANARKLIEDCDAATGIPATYVQSTPDLMMGDLLKNMRSSQIFSVCGLPEIRLFSSKEKNKQGYFQVALLGLDVFDPTTMETDHRKGDDVPAWLLDTDYNGMVFHVRQAFFPRTSAWDSIKRSLKADFEDSVWEHLSGTTSAPFEPGNHGRIAVKVIDDRGNELMVEKDIKEAEK